MFVVIQKTYTDQMKREVTIVASPFRIVSLVPSQTELLVDLGLEERLVGVTKFCIHPEGLKKRVQVIGGTKNLHIDKIRALKPDLIIGNKEENTQSDIEILEKEFPVWMSDIYTVQDSLEMILELGEITQTVSRASALVQQIQRGFELIDPALLRGQKVAYFIWKDPWMCAGRETFIDDVLTRIGLQNVVTKSRYPEFTAEFETPDWIFLSSEPFPFTTEHVELMRRKYPNSQVMIVDGEAFSWYGSRLIHAAEYVQKLTRELAQS